MSDDLVKRLRDWENVYAVDDDKPEGSLYIEAADRIEELEDKNSNLCDLAYEEHKRAMTAEHRLEKAVEVLGDDPWRYGWHGWRDRIVATLAELNGEK